MTTPPAARAWVASEIGPVRPHNEDAAVMAPELGLYLVADGMGGHARGEVASTLACSVVREALAARRQRLEAIRCRLEPLGLPTPEDSREAEALLVEAVRRANAEVHGAAPALAGAEGRLGTTLEALLLVGRRAWLAHVGDSRTWLLRGATARLLTRDHTLAEERRRRGLSSPRQAGGPRGRNALTRALGVMPAVEVDVVTVDLLEGDRVLMATDGFYRHVSAEEAAARLGAMDPGVALDLLVGLAEQRGGRDNITALLLELGGPTEHRSEPADADRIAVLRRCELFAYCTWRELASVAARCRAIHVPPGHVFFEEGDAGREAYILRSGRVRLTRGGVHLGDVAPPGHFGEFSFINRPRRLTTATATDPTSALVLARRDFLDLARRDTVLANRVMWQMLRHFSSIVAATDERLVAALRRRGR